MVGNYWVFSQGDIIKISGSSRHAMNDIDSKFLMVMKDHFPLLTRLMGYDKINKSWCTMSLLFNVWVHGIFELLSNKKGRQFSVQCKYYTLVSSVCKHGIWKYDFSNATE